MSVRQVIRKASDRERHPVVLESVGCSVLSSNRMVCERKFSSKTRFIALVDFPSERSTLTSFREITHQFLAGPCSALGPSVRPSKQETCFILGCQNAGGLGFDPESMKLQVKYTNQAAHTLGGTSSFGRTSRRSGIVCF